MQVNLKSNKSHSASFSSLQMNESFNHFRSVSYFEAVTTASISGSHQSFNNCYHLQRAKFERTCSNSTPCTPKRIEIGKYSTLPTNYDDSSIRVKQSKSSSLSSFFRKLKPRFHRSASDSKSPWIVIEFSPSSNDDRSSDSEKSDNSLELALKSKVQHFSSLKDLYENSDHDLCNCALGNKRKGHPGSPKCNSGYTSAKRNSESLESRSPRTASQFRSENSIFFHLSPKRRLENMKLVLKRLSHCKHHKNSASLPSLNCRSTIQKSDNQFRNHLISSRPAYPSSAQRSYQSDASFLRLPTSRSVNSSLSSVLEDSSLRRVQPPKTLSLCSKNFREQQSHRLFQKMASVESIGACSLDFDASAADSFMARKDRTASECTLHSNGLTPSSLKDLSRNSSLLTDDQAKEQRLFPGLKAGDKKDYSVSELKLPSYVSISCAINGYTNYSRFCRSRDNSPARSSFRKSSFEPTMISEMNGKEPHSLDSHFRYTRSQSDCNGRLHSLCLEPKLVTNSKQPDIPSQSSSKLSIGNDLTNGQQNGVADRVERTACSPIKEMSNGHSGDSLSLAKEVGNGGTKSLVQQRIESLYGKSKDIKISVKHSTKVQQVNGVEMSSTLESVTTTSAKVHRTSTSPPVFRHLNKDFRKQLLANAEDQKVDSEKVVKPVKKSTEKKESSVHSKSNGSALTSNDTGHDECDRAKSQTPPPKLSDMSFETRKSLSESGSEKEREGYSYLSLVDIERDKILASIKKLEGELQGNPAIPEEALGKIRAACGKANLLISQKFEQFKGLCWKNIEDDPSVPFYTTASDLAGFWDLVKLQIDDINSTFDDIDQMKNNNWKDVVSDKNPCLGKPRTVFPKAAVSRSNPSTPKRSSKSIEQAKAREEARKQLLAAKKKGRQQAPSSETEVAIFAPVSGSS